MFKHSNDGDVINNLVCCCFDQSKLRSSLILEWIGWSNFLCKVYKSCRWHGSLSDPAIARVWVQSIKTYISNRLPNSIHTIFVFGGSQEAMYKLSSSEADQTYHTGTFNGRNH